VPSDELFELARASAWKHAHLGKDRVMADSLGPQIGDLVEVRLTGRVISRRGDDEVTVLLQHPHDGKQLVDLLFSGDDVVVLERRD
jgi:hypothetical protein